MKRAGPKKDGPVTKRRRLDHRPENPTVPTIADLISADDIVDSAAEGSWNSSSTIRLVEEVIPSVTLKRCLMCC